MKFDNKQISQYFIIFSTISLLCACSTSSDINCVNNSIEETSVIITLRNAQDTTILIGSSQQGSLYNATSSEFYYFEGDMRIPVTFPTSSKIFLDFERNEIVSDQLLEVDYFVDLVSNSTNMVDTDSILIKYMLGDIPDCLHRGTEQARELTFLQFFYNGIEQYKSSSGDNLISLLINKN